MVKRAGPQLNVENSKTQSDTFAASVKADQAALENLKVQLSYTKIRTPISGRISQAAVKIGNFARSADVFRSPPLIRWLRLTSHFRFLSAACRNCV